MPNTYWQLEETIDQWQLEENIDLWQLEEDAGSDVFIVGLSTIEHGVVAITAAGMGGILQT